MEYETLLVEKSDHIATVTLNRPEKLNAINDQLLMDLEALANELREDFVTRVVILTGAGRAFSAGIDLSRLQDLAGAQQAQIPSAVERRRRGQLGQRAMNALERVEQVTIAAINGVAVGGGVSIALACDLRIAAESARFWIPEVNLGVPLSWGTIPRLVRLVGPAKAKELIMACDWVDANEALAIGLLNKVFPLDKLMECAQEMAEKIATKAPLAITMTKAAVNAVSAIGFGEMTYSDSDLLQLCSGTEDIREGLRASIEKRKPKFTGR